MAFQEWFESWFDSSLYEQLYAYRDDTEAARLVSLLTDRFPPDLFPGVLDMGCGRGRHAILMAQKGYLVTGIDLSPKSVAQAQKKSEEMQLENIRFETEDMRTYRKGPFDMVCNLFTSFGYFEDDRDNIHVLRNMHANMREGGRLIIDYLNPDYIRRQLVTDESLEVGNVMCHITRAIEADMVVKSMTFIEKNGDATRKYQERVKLYDKEWFSARFEEMGFTDVQILGNYDGHPYHEHSSPRLLMLAES